jgi:predicted O-methyltransferase YrrM
MLGETAYHFANRLGIKDALKSILPRRLTQPFRVALHYEMLALESRKSDWNLIELKDFPELRKSSWCGLPSLAYEIVQDYKPKVVVELGTHMGLSALSMGIALRDLGEGGMLFAVDTWQGDEQAGFYGDDVYQQFLARRSHLGLDRAIVPLRMTFDEARDQMPPSIDLLHIDGLHTRQAINHDFDTYRPLVRPGGLILFHDVRTGFPDMRAFWRRLSTKYEHYCVPYSHGLGVIRV